MMQFIQLLRSSLILVCFCYISCKQSYKEEAIAINDRALKIMHQNADSALILLNEAIAVEPSYSVTYLNKASIYIEQENFESAIESMEKRVSLNPVLAEEIAMLGMLYEYVGEIELANFRYEQAIVIYEKRLQSSDEFRFQNEVNIAWTLILLGNELEGRTQLQNLLRDNPDDLSLQNSINLEKEDYLESFLGNNRYSNTRLKVEGE